MSSESPTPWILIVSAFSKLQELCQQAGAQEKRVREAEQARLEALKTPGLSLPRAPGNEGADLVALRAGLRSCLLSLKTDLSRSSLTETDGFHALFPLTLYADELARSATQGRVDAWPPLQRELLDCDDGGVRFYKHLDVLLSRRETPPLIFQVFALCFGGGFVGQYRNNPGKLEEYQRRLKDCIPVLPPSEWSVHRGQNPAVELVAFPARYYVFAVVAVLGVFALLHMVSMIEALSVTG
jgi:type VI protein secretion system component VasF